MQTTFSRLKLATAVLFAASTVFSAVAQLSSGPSSTVVYVSGDDLVLKASDGKLLNYTVPSGVKFSVASGKVGLSELKPGTQITAPVVTGFDPKVVSAINVVKGKVYAVTPPDGVTLLLTEGVKELSVPAGTTFMVDGKSLKVAELKPDMVVEATIVTTADADAASATSTPTLVGALLVSKSASADDMPAAGTKLPLYGMLGLALVMAGWMMRRFGRAPAFQN